MVSFSYFRSLMPWATVALIVFSAPAISRSSSPGRFSGSVTFSPSTSLPAISMITRAGRTARLAETILITTIATSSTPMEMSIRLRNVMAALDSVRIGRPAST